MQARILVVDDEQTIAQTLSVILQNQGYQVATAFSGEAAVAEAASFIPDLLLTDVCLGTMNGIEAAVKITAILPECRVLFISGLASASDVFNIAPQRLVYSFTSKPLHPLDLLNAIAYILSAVNTAGDPAVTAVEDDAIQRYAIGKVPNKAGFIFRKAQTEIKNRAAIQGNPDAVLFDMTFPDMGGRDMLLQ
jgi:CheY-like chemotaxis protein